MQKESPIWRIQRDGKETIEIDIHCREKIPCEHATNGMITNNGCGIWLELCTHPELEIQQPDLWAHFKEQKQYLDRYKPEVVPNISTHRLLNRVGKVRIKSPNESRTMAPTKPPTKRDKSPKARASRKKT